ncbi:MULTISPECIES: hypothetical protein [Streptomyces]|uniref:hypothetical protein n=1 Tax=Streptomyces TaxID=1883 RepID=UPI0011B00E86|nr:MULTISPECIES: hypothetical protein [unclassified Streptomyces]
MISFWEDRRTADADFAAACAALGHGPDERHEEDRGTAFWWTTNQPAWPYGVVLFWRHGRDWRCIPLDRDEKPVRDGVERLPWAFELAPDEIAQRVAVLLNAGPRLT